MQYVLGSRAGDVLHDVVTSVIFDYDMFHFMFQCLSNCCLFEHLEVLEKCRMSLKNSIITAMWKTFAMVTNSVGNALLKFTCISAAHGCFFN